MDVGQTATAGQHYSKHWEAADSKPFHSSESWKDRKLGCAAAGGDSYSAIRSSIWEDARHTSLASSSPASLSSLLPIIGTDGSVDKVLYQNLVEMIPLVETFMDQQSSKSFPRHASLIYTPTPARDALPLKKAVDQPFKGKRVPGQFVRGKRGDLKDSLFWDNADNKLHDNRELYSEEIPMLSFPTDYQVDQTAFNRAEIVQLQSQIELLEQRLQEKENQLQASENSTLKVDLQKLQTEVTELQKQISVKEEENREAHQFLLEKQNELTSLQSCFEKADADAKASNACLAQVQEQLQSLRLQMALLLFQLQIISSTFDNDDQVIDEAEISNTAAITYTEAHTMEHSNSNKRDDSETEQIELTRRKYLAALIAARENQAEELLLLVAELRAQLQAYVMRREVISISTSSESFGEQFPTTNSVQTHTYT